MSEHEPVTCNAIIGDGCIKHEGFTLCEGSQCRGGLWENRSIAPHIIRIDRCDGTADPLVTDEQPEISENS